MYSEEEREQIIRLLNVCKGIDGTEPHVYKNGDVYGVEFEGYQTLKITIEPMFDMQEAEVSALVNLMARVLPIAQHIIEESNEKEAKIEALLDCVATISLIASEKMRRTGKTTIIQEDEEEQTQLTIGVK